MDLCQVKLLLLVVNHPQSIPGKQHTCGLNTDRSDGNKLPVSTCISRITTPCIVVAVVDSDGVSKAGESSVQLLRQNKLVAQQSVGIRKTWVHLRQLRPEDR